MDKRIEQEAVFHDKAAEHFTDGEELVHAYFQSPTAVENRYILARMGQLKDRQILDFGCGIGEASVYFALQGAHVTGIDVSPKTVQVAQTVAIRHKAPVTFLISQQNNLSEFPDGSFDLIYGNGVLHHIDCAAYFPEFKRVLRPGGRAFFIDPLPYNPLINIYRKIATEVRSPAEKPIGVREIRLAEKYFKVKTTGFWLTALYLFCHFYLFERADPNKEKYWRKIIREGEKYRNPFGVLNGIDRCLLGICPPLKYLCWNLVTELEKTE